MKSATRLAVFRADATPDLGTGHVQRCITLARGLMSRGWDCTFASRPPTWQTAQRPDGVDTGFDLDDIDEPAALSRQWPEGCDLLVVDHYGRDATFETACRPWAKRIFIIDDLADRDHDCEVLLDQTAGRIPADYVGRVPVSCTVLAGADFALLRPEFAAGRNAALDGLRVRAPPERIFVSIGATDPFNVTALTLDGIARSQGTWTVDVVLTSSAPHLDDILNRTGGANVTVHVDSCDMAGLMAAADVAIGAAGSTSWERCCLALPTLFVTVANNQTLIGRMLVDVGAAEDLGRPDAGLTGRIAEALDSLRSRPKILRIMAERAATICDGRGVERIMEALNT